MVNKKNNNKSKKNNKSSNSMFFGRWLQTKMNTDQIYTSVANNLKNSKGTSVSPNGRCSPKCSSYISF